MGRWRVFGWHFEVVPCRDRRKDFVLEQNRWIVERTFSWLGRYRRLSKDYERLCWTNEAMVHRGAIRLLAKRL